MNNIIEREIFELAQSMVQFGASLDDVVKELQAMYAEALEETARRAREYKSK